MYQNIWASLVKFSRDLNTTYLLGAEVYDFEAHAITEELPNTHLIGPHSLSMSADPVEFASFAIGFSSYGEDRALFHQRAAISSIYESLKPEQQIPLYHAGTALQIGNLIITEDTIIPPMTRASARPFQTVHAMGRVTLND